MEDKYNFQYCQKIVVFSKDLNSVLLCQRKGEEDYDNVYSFIGGKMEITDSDIVSGMQREKNEEVGKDFKIEICSEFSSNRSYKKKSGKFMILPHYYARHLSGDINLNEEYSNYKWVNLNELDAFEPKIENISKMVKRMLELKKVITDKNLIVI